MFTHRCTECDRRQLIFPSQFTNVTETSRGLVATFTCWCGVDQTIRPTGLADVAA